MARTVIDATFGDREGRALRAPLRCHHEGQRALSIAISLNDGNAGRCRPRRYHRAGDEIGRDELLGCGARDRVPS